MLRYRIALINVWWHQGDENQPYFDNVQSQTAYFNELTANGDYFTSLVNFNMADNVSTTIIYRDSSNRLPEQLVACNYAVIEWENPETGAKYFRYYYALCSQDSGTQMRVDLLLDDIQTNYFRFKDNFNDVYIKRANLNRFISVKLPNGNTGWQLNLADERFWIDEELPPVKQYCYDKYQNEFEFPLIPWSERLADTGKTEAAFQFYKTYIIGWEVLFVANNAELKIGTNTLTPGIMDYQIDHWRAPGLYEQPSPFQAPFGIIAAPIYKRVENDTKQPLIVLQATDGECQLTNIIQQILNNPDNVPFIYSFQLTSHNFLLPYLVANGDVAVIETNNQIRLQIGCAWEDSIWVPTRQTSTTPNLPNEKDQTEARIFYKNNGLITGYTQPSKEMLRVDIWGENLPHVYEDKAQLKGIGVRLNPKLWASQYQNYHVEYYDGSSFTIDLLRLGYTNSRGDYGYLLFDWTEILSTTITQSIITYYSAGFGSQYNSYINSVNPYFRELSTVSDEGLICSMDQSMLFYTNNYSEYIANNKNYYTQRQYNLSMDAKQWALNESAGIIQSVAGGASSGGILGAAISGLGSGASAALSAANLALTQERTIANSEFDLANMRGAPNSLKGSGSSVLNSAMRKRFGLRVTHWQIPDRFMKRFNNYMNLFGYKVEEELKSIDETETMTTYDCNRKFWNYLECTVGTIGHSSNPLNGVTYLSNQEEERLKDALTLGVRFWRNCQIINGESVSPVNFNQPNYELWLDE